MSNKALPLKARLYTGAALAAATGLLGGLSARLFFLGGQTFEFCHYGEIAANLLAGKGFASSTFYPATLAYFKRWGLEIADIGPVVDRFPLQVVLVAAAIWP